MSLHDYKILVILRQPLLSPTNGGNMLRMVGDPFPTSGGNMLRMVGDPRHNDQTFSVS